MKRVLCIALALALCFTVVAPGMTARGAGFADVSSAYWAADEINALAARGVVAGTTTTRFSPDASVTREQFAKMIVLAKGLKEYKPTIPTFTDVPANRWSFGFIEAAAKSGYVSGIGSGKFGPTTAIKREDLALLLTRVLGQTAEAAKITEPICFANDEDLIDRYAVGAMTIAVRPRVQLLKWDAVMNINPRKPATRADCAFAVYNTIVPPTTSTKKQITTVDDEGPESLFNLITDSAYSQKAYSYLASSTVQVTPDGVAFPSMFKYVPSLANGKLVRNADGTVVTTVELRKGLNFSDGHLVDIDDFIFTHKLIMSNDVQIVSRTPMDLVTRIERLGTYSAKVYWKSWDPFELVFWDCYPEHILGPMFEKDPKDINTSTFNSKPVYCGPYTVLNHIEGQYMTLEANPDWFGGEPVIEKIVAKFIDNTNTILVNLLTGQIDLSSETLTLDMAKELERRMSKTFGIEYVTGAAVGILEYIGTNEFWKDKRVRQAFMYAVDRNLLTQKANVGFDAVMSPLGNSSAYTHPVLDKYAYNPDKANQLLDAAGWKWDASHEYRTLPSGKRAVLVFSYATGAAFREREVTIMEPMLKKVGIKAEHNPTDFDGMLDALTAGTLEGVSLHGTGFSNFDPYGTVNQFNSDQIPTPANGMQGQNNNRYNNPEMDKWLDAVQKATTTSALTTAYAHVEEIFAEDLPCIYLETRAYPDVIRRGLKSYSHKAVGNVYNNWNAPWWYWKSA